MNERSFIVNTYSCTSPSVLGSTARKKWSRNTTCRRDAALQGPVGAARRRYYSWTANRRGCSRFRIYHCFHVMRDNRHRLRRRVEPSERIRSWLPHKLHDRGEHAQNARGIYRRFHYPPALRL